MREERTFGLLVLSKLDRIVNVAEDDADGLFVRHVEREELDHVEVLDLRLSEAMNDVTWGGDVAECASDDRAT